MKNLVFRILSVLVLSSITLIGYAQSTFSTSGNWSVASNWSPSGVPAAGTTVTIAAGVSCTVDGNYSCAAINFAATGANSSITVNSGFTLSVTGTIALTEPAINNTQQLIVGDGTVTCAGLTMTNTTSSAYKNRLSINNGQITISTTFAMNGGAVGENELVFTGSGRLIFNGTTFGLAANDTYTRGTGTIQLGRSGTQTLTAGITYHNIILAGNNTKTITNTTMNKLTINSGVTASCGNNNLTVNDTLLNNGTLTFTSTTGTKIIAGHFVNNGTFTNTIGEAVEFRRGIENNGTFTPGAGLYTFTTNAQDIKNGTQAIVFAGAVTVNSPAVVNNYDSVVIPGTFTISAGATWRNQANSQLNLTGTATLTGTMNCDGTNNTVYFNSASAQSSPAGAVYVNLSKTTSSTLTLGNTTISGRLLINTGTIDMGANTITVGQSLNGSGTITQAAGGVLNIGGNNLHSGTHTISTATVNYNGSADQTIRSLTYNNLGISGSGIKSLAGNTSIDGTLTLTAGTLAINGNTLTINGAVSTTTGNIRGSNTSKLTVAGAAAAASLSFDQTNQASRSLSNLTNTRANGITIANALEIIDSINVSNGTIASGGNITLVSTSSNTARVARITSGGISGDVKVQRFIPGGSNKRKWRFLSFPVNNGTGGMPISEFIDDIHVTGTNGSTNGFDDCGGCGASLRTYTESVAGSSANGWTNPANINAVIPTGTGFEVFVRGDRTTVVNPFLGTSVPTDVTIDYVGTINSGNYTFDLSYTNTGDAGDGFNLVANPYPSQIDWAASNGWTRTNINAHAYVYDANLGQYGTVSTSGINGIGVGTMSRYIPSGQAFFVKANAASPSISMTESIKVTNTPFNFFKNASSVAPTLHYVRFKLIAPNFQDNFVIRLDSNVSDSAKDFDDAAKLFNDRLNFYTKSAENINLAINHYPIPGSANVEDTINISVFSFNDSTIEYRTHTIELSEKINIDNNIKFDLIDNYTNERIKISELGTYSFDIDSNTTSYGNNRFKLVIYQSAVGINSTKNNKTITVYPNPANNLIYFKNNSLLPEEVTISLLNLQGQLLKKESKLMNTEKGFMNINNISEGVYLLKIEGKNFTESHKFIKK